MAKQTPLFLYEGCISCGICQQACPVSVIVLDKTGVDAWQKAYPRLSERPCIGCALCQKSCPMGAIQMETVA